MLETVRLVRLVQEQFDDEFAETAGTLVCYLVLELLEKEAPQHDNAESEQRKKNRKYNSNTFVFHNLAALMGALKFDVMKTLDFDLLKWRGIANHIPTKSKDRTLCRLTQNAGPNGARSSVCSTLPSAPPPNSRISSSSPKLCDRNPNQRSR